MSNKSEEATIKNAHNFEGGEKLFLFTDLKILNVNLSLDFIP